MSRYRHVSAMKAKGFPVAVACEAAEVSSSAYYGWLAREADGTLPRSLLKFSGGHSSFRLLPDRTLRV